MFFDNSMDNRKTEAGAKVFGSEKWIEYPHNILLLDPFPGIATGNAQRFVSLPILRQELSKGLDRHQRVLDLVRHSGGKRSEADESIAAANLQLKSFQRGNVRHHHERAQKLAALPPENRAAGASECPSSQLHFPIF